MDNFGKNRRAGGAVYELLTVDTSGDDEDVGKQEDQQPALPLVAKVRGKRRKHKSRKVQTLELGAVSAQGEGETNSLGLASGLVIGSSRDVLSFKDLLLPRPDGILADLPLEPRINVDSGDASKEAPFQDFSQEFPLESVGALESGQKSPPSSESLRNLAMGVSRPSDLLLLTRESVEVRNMPIHLNLGPENRAAIVDSKLIDSSSIDGGLVSVSPNSRFSGRTSPVSAGITSISGYSPRGGSQREPLFPELRQRAVEKLSDPPVQENGVDGVAMPTLTKAVSFKKQKAEADPSYLGHVDVIEQSPGFRAPPRLPLSSYETPHLTEWERLMVANSEWVLMSMDLLRQMAEDTDPARSRSSTQLHFIDQMEEYEGCTVDCTYYQYSGADQDACCRKNHYNRKWGPLSPPAFQFLDGNFAFKLRMTPEAARNHPFLRRTPGIDYSQRSNSTNYVYLFPDPIPAPVQAPEPSLALPPLFWDDYQQPFDAPWENKPPEITAYPPIVTDYNPYGEVEPPIA